MRGPFAVGTVPLSRGLRAGSAVPAGIPTFVFSWALQLSSVSSSLQFGEAGGPCLNGVVLSDRLHPRKRTRSNVGCFGTNSHNWAKAKRKNYQSGASSFKLSNRGPLEVGFLFSGRHQSGALSASLATASAWSWIPLLGPSSSSSNPLTSSPPPFSFFGMVVKNGEV
ncbi:hypothetical protein C2S51_020007 [Perilla frutescens var. frutescens]|nr:hypothetical protein C2S51_020007 [Perilla frutescens var. frutescens]